MPVPVHSRWTWAGPMRAFLTTNSSRWLARPWRRSRKTRLSSVATARSGPTPTKASRRASLGRYLLHLEIYNSSLFMCVGFLCVFYWSHFGFKADFMAHNFGFTNMKGFVTAMQREGKLHNAILVEQVRDKMIFLYVQWCSWMNSYLILMVDSTVILRHTLQTLS